MKRFLLYLVTLIVPFVVVAQQAERPQYVVFQVIPKTATVTVGGNSVATDSDGLAIFLLNNGCHYYVVSANEYHGASGYVDVSGSKVVKNVVLSPNYGWLTIPSTDALKGAKVYIGGNFIGEVPIEKMKLSSGTHTVRIVPNNDKYKEFEGAVSINDGRTYEYSPKLSLRMGVLNITSAPAMANIVVDGKYVGQTPLMLDLAVGEHKVKVSKSAFGADSKSVTVGEGAVTDVNFTLTKITDYVEAIGGVEGIKMILVEDGTFQMGATSEQGDDYDSNEKPVHSVTLDSYYIAECEITQAQWRAIMGTTVYQQRDKRDSTLLVRGVGDNHPMYYVSWEEAQEFCQKLSKLTGKEYALPTEAQWEYAARGGNKSRGYKYSGSNTIDAVAWYAGNSNDETHPVKQKQPNELGLYDMSGNVWEWCSDWYGDYSSLDQTNPTGPSSGSYYRVGRGDGWYDSSNGWYSRVSSRGYNYPSYYSYDVGFRVVRLLDDERPFIKVEKMPSFRGGDLMTFRNWVMERIRYPQIAQENSIQGRVLLSFVIERDGSLTNVQVLQSPHSSLSDEAVRVVKASPKWSPGKQGDKVVRVKYTLPIEFRVQN